MCTGNENSKPIWNKLIIRKDIIETSQVVLNFCRTVYIPWILRINLFKPTNPKDEFGFVGLNKFMSKIHGIYGL